MDEWNALKYLKYSVEVIVAVNDSLLPQLSFIAVNIVHDVKLVESMQALRANIEA